MDGLIHGQRDMDRETCALYSVSDKRTAISDIKSQCWQYWQLRKAASRQCIEIHAAHTGTSSHTYSKRHEVWS